MERFRREKRGLLKRGVVQEREKRFVERFRRENPLPGAQHSGDTTPCRMTGVNLHSHVRYKEI